MKNSHLVGSLLFSLMTSSSFAQNTEIENPKELFSFEQMDDSDSKSRVQQVFGGITEFGLGVSSFATAEVFPARLPIEAINSKKVRRLLVQKLEAIRLLRKALRIHVAVKNSQSSREFQMAERKLIEINTSLLRASKVSTITPKRYLQKIAPRFLRYLGFYLAIDGSLRCLMVTEDKQNPGPSPIGQYVLLGGERAVHQAIKIFSAQERESVEAVEIRDLSVDELVDSL